VTTFRLEVNEEQALVLREALDVYERVLGLGQVEELEFRWGMDRSPSQEGWERTRETMRFLCYAMKSAGWGHGPNSSHGIRSEKVPRKYRVAYDITQVLRHALAEARVAELEASGDRDLADRLRNTVDFDRFWSTEADVKPAVVSWTRTDGEGT